MRGTNDRPITSTHPITDEQIAALRQEAAAAGDDAQRILCEIALHGEDDAADHAAAVWTENEYARIRGMDEPGVRWALRLTSTEARAECARIITDSLKERTR